MRVLWLGGRGPVLMALQSKHLGGLEPAFDWAGFTWPRYEARLDPRPAARRLADRRRLVCGEYYRAPAPAVDGQPRAGLTFYLESDFMLGSRWQWADQVDERIRHTGWWCDDDGDGWKLRGLVIALSHGRWLAGWSMGEGLASFVEARVVWNPREAARLADRLAELAAEEEREHQAAREAGE